MAKQRDSKTLMAQTDEALAANVRMSETLIRQTRAQLETCSQSKRATLERTMEGATKGLEAVRHEIARRQMDIAHDHD